MKPSTQLELLEYFAQAEKERVGLQLTFATPDEAKLFRAKLYAARKGISEYENYSILCRGIELFIAKDTVDAEGTED